MRLKSVVSEAWRNVASGTTRALWFGAALAVAACLTAYLEAAAVNRIDEEAIRFRSAGASTFILSAPQGISGEACEALAGAGGITRSGALRTPSTALRHRALPSSPITYKEVTQGFPDLLAVTGRSEQSVGLIVSSSVANVLGVRPGAVFQNDTGNVPIAGVYEFPDDGRSPELEFAAVGVVPSVGTFDECWAEVWPSDRSATQRLRSALSAAAQPDTQPELRQLNATLGTDFDVDELFDQRLTRYGSGALLVVGMVLGAVSVWLRRLELASALHCGVPKICQAVQTMLETMLWATAGVLLAAPVLVYEAEAGVSPIPVMALGLRCLAGAWTGAVIGAVVAVLSVRERNLFRFFKGR